MCIGLSCRVARLAAAALVALAAPLSAWCADLPKVRFAYLRTLEVMPFLHGVAKGYFKQEGIDVELIAVPGGPAVGAALASGSADFGYAALSPVLIAREQGQPFRFFMSMEWERAPDRLWGYMVATERSGIKSLKDYKGKNIVVGPPGSLCELTARDWMRSAGLSFADATILNNPFPQLPAMFEAGTADGGCIVEPFATAALAGKARPIVLARGALADVREKYRVSGLFATEEWIRTHAKEIAAVKRAFVRAGRELNADQSLAKDLLARDYRFPPTLIERLNIDIPVDVDPKAEEYAIVIARVRELGVLTKPMRAQDVISTAPPAKQ